MNVKMNELFNLKTDVPSNKNKINQKNKDEFKKSLKSEKSKDLKSEKKVVKVKDNKKTIKAKKTLTKPKDKITDKEISLPKKIDEAITTIEALSVVGLNLDEDIFSSGESAKIIEGLIEIKNFLYENADALNNTQLLDKIKEVLNDQLSSESLLSNGLGSIKEITSDLVKEMKEFKIRGKNLSDKNLEQDISQSIEIVESDENKLKNYNLNNSQLKDNKSKEKFNDEKAITIMDNDLNKNNNRLNFNEININPMKVQEMEIQETVGDNNLKSVESLMTKQLDASKVINQIVQKASVNIKETKSEMIIDLKPEHLGKISMKIEVEREMVVAKIVAENQVVKETIESNLEDLRESLEERGFSIEEFSVDVSKDDSKESTQQFMNFRNNRSKFKGISDDLEDTTEDITVDKISSNVVNNLG